MQRGRGQAAGVEQSSWESTESRAPHKRAVVWGWGSDWQGTGVTCASGRWMMLLHLDAFGTGPWHPSDIGSRS